MKRVRGQKHYKSVKAPARKILNPFITWTDFTDTQQEKRKDNICCCLFSCFRSRDCHDVTETAPVPHAVQSKARRTNFLTFLCHSSHQQAWHLSGWGVVWTGTLPHGVVFLLKQQWGSALSCLGWMFFCTEGKSKKIPCTRTPSSQILSQAATGRS